MYFAGWIRANATVSMGTGFTVSRNLVQGSYLVTANATSTGLNMVPIVTPAQPNVHARIVQFFRDASLKNNFEVEMRDNDGNLVDSDFTFILIQRS